MRYIVSLQIILPGVLTLAMIPQPAAADMIHFDASVSQMFNTAATWNPQQVPGANDTAIFDPALGQTCFFDVSPTNNQAWVLKDTTWFGLVADAVYTLEDGMWVGDVNNFQIQSVDVVSLDGALSMAGSQAFALGSHLTFDVVRLGDSFLLDGQSYIGPGTLNISGQSSRLQANSILAGLLSHGELRFAGGATGELGAVFVPPFGGDCLEGISTGAMSVLSGSVVEIGSLEVASDQFCAFGDLHADGLGTVVELMSEAATQVGANAFIPEGNAGNMLITNGALVRKHGGPPAEPGVALWINETGTITLESGGTLEAMPGSTILDHGRIERAVDGNLLLRNNATLRVESNFLMPGEPAGILDIAGGFDFGTDPGAEGTHMLVLDGGQAESDLAWRFPMNSVSKARTLVSQVGDDGPSRITVGSAGAPNADFVVGHAGEGEFEVSMGGSVVVGNDFVVGNLSDGVGVATITSVDGPDRSHVTAEGDVIIGHQGVGELLISDGAFVTGGRRFVVGSQPGAEGSATLHGVFSSTPSLVSIVGPDAGIYIGGDSNSSDGGQGVLQVLLGAQLETSGSMELASHSGSTADVTVSGRGGGDPFVPIASTINVGESLRIAGDESTPGGNATMVVAEGGQLLVDGGMTIWPAGSLVVEGGIPGLVQVGSNLTVQGAVELGGGAITVLGTVDTIPGASDPPSIIGWGRVLSGAGLTDEGLLAPRALDDFGPCVGFCGEQSDQGCWCDDLCDNFGDCCTSACAACPDAEYCPADGLGVLEFATEQYTQLPGGLMDFEIGPGTAALTQAYFSGTVDLHGDVVVTFADGFPPGTDQEFVLVAGSAITGAFATENLPRGYTLTYSTDRVLLTPSTQSCSGDLTGGGEVNVDDLLMILNNWGPCGNGQPGCAGDANMDGEVNVDDLLMVLNNWGPCE